MRNWQAPATSIVTRTARTPRKPRAGAGTRTPDLLITKRRPADFRKRSARDYAIPACQSVPNRHVNRHALREARGLAEVAP